ncbi:MAG: hydrogenase iron-sulfur subunit [Syntrophobacteraceae bacterium]|nr:hydrogenase iron-sulfur subunit [Syntrophobacteraceae bacterium]
MTFEPIILGFACNWCSYPAADLAGTVRMQYPTNVRIIRVMCAGMVHPNLVVEAFHQGADGVIVMGCPPGECHYLEGNSKTEARMAVLQDVLPVLGIEKDRFRLVWFSSAEAEQFVTMAKEITELLKGLGPSPFRRKEESSGRLSASPAS